MRLQAPLDFLSDLSARPHQLLLLLLERGAFLCLCIYLLLQVHALLLLLFTDSFHGLHPTLPQLVLELFLHGVVPLLRIEGVLDFCVYDLPLLFDLLLSSSF